MWDDKASIIKLIIIVLVVAGTVAKMIYESFVKSVKSAAEAEKRRREMAGSRGPAHAEQAERGPAEEIRSFLDEIRGRQGDEQASRRDEARSARPPSRAPEIEREIIEVERFPPPARDVPRRAVPAEAPAPVPLAIHPPLAADRPVRDIHQYIEGLTRRAGEGGATRRSTRAEGAIPGLRLDLAEAMLAQVILGPPRSREGRAGRARPGRGGSLGRPGSGQGLRGGAGRLDASTGPR